MSNPTELPDLRNVIQNAYIGYTGEHLDAGIAEAIAKEIVARRAQPEGEAPQADTIDTAEFRDLLHTVQALFIGDASAAKAALIAHIDARIAQAAQHAESGAHMVTVPASLLEWAQQNIDCDEGAEEKKSVSDALGAALAVQHAESGVAQAVYLSNEIMAEICEVAGYENLSMQQIREVLDRHALAAQSQGAQASELSNLCEVFGINVPEGLTPMTAIACRLKDLQDRAAAK